MHLLLSHFPDAHGGVFGSCPQDEAVRMELD